MSGVVAHCGRWSDLTGGTADAVRVVSGVVAHCGRRVPPAPVVPECGERS